ncbi:MULTISPECIES: hypothetical protein [unclassified Nesterenkonia]|uniref:hypothetical protein n=1 Tax=unclassified Nesterenkonia TaxID=2629769 RepID=UPI001F4C7D6A|nr:MULTISPECIES: hypothetical protein [unclassified Nesterenkonia]MCH8560440.1 hypothetical protein [Nesterenkonia sp. DZ6]MCH8562706.1 hypothetical protein [Nesterenkonia sp. YGD6]
MTNPSTPTTSTTTAPAAPASPMPRLTLIVGGLLVVIGIIGYVATDFASMTALIPSVVGLLLLISGGIAMKNRKLGVHIALAVALLGAFGMIMPLMSLPELFAGESENPGAVISSLVTVIVLVIYIVLGVRSFIAARRWKDAR